MSNAKLFFRRVRDQGEFDEFIEKAGLKSKHFVIKPNWWNWGYAEYTEAETLEFLLRSLDGKITVTEGYSPRVDVRVPEEEKTVQPSVRYSYTTVLQLGGVLWMSKRDREWIKRRDEEFLRETGIKKLFDEYDVDYVNVTEEVWAGNTVNKEKIRKLVENKYSPVERHELYNWIPKSLYRLKGSIFISFAKIKGVEPLDSLREEYKPSLATKNLFGLIPHPLRTNFHGRDNCELDQNILDINKIYHSIFEVVGINEALHTCMVSDPSGPYKAGWGVYDVIKNSGLVVFGRNLVHLDAYTCKLIGKYPERVPYLRLTTKEFGEWDKKLIDSTNPELRVMIKGHPRGEAI